MGCKIYFTLIGSELLEVENVSSQGRSGRKKMEYHMLSKLLCVFLLFSCVLLGAVSCAADTTLSNGFTQSFADKLTQNPYIILIVNLLLAPLPLFIFWKANKSATFTEFFVVCYMWNIGLQGIQVFLNFVLSKWWSHFPNGSFHPSWNIGYDLRIIDCIIYYLVDSIIETDDRLYFGLYLFYGSISYIVLPFLPLILRKILNGLWIVFLVFCIPWMSHFS